MALKSPRPPIPVNVSMVITTQRVYQEDGSYMPTGMVISMQHPTPLEQHLLIHKLDHILPCDGRKLDREKYPELYAVMENALPPGSEIRVPDLTHESQFAGFVRQE